MTINFIDRALCIDIEIRDNQQLAMKRQEEHLAIAKEQIARSKGQVQESVDLQRIAIDKVKLVSRIAIPGIVLCIVLTAYLLIKYF